MSSTSIDGHSQQRQARNSAEGQQMVIVAGHIVVDPHQRESYLADMRSLT